MLWVPSSLSLSHFESSIFCFLTICFVCRSNKKVKKWKKKFPSAERGFDPRTSGLWAQRRFHCATLLCIFQSTFTCFKTTSPFMNSSQDWANLPFPKIIISQLMDRWCQNTSVIILQLRVPPPNLASVRDFHGKAHKLARSLKITSY